MPHKKFCYLIQSPDYLPDFVEQLNTEHSVAYILTFREPIKYKHTFFIPAETCTWTDGRNALAARLKDQDYLYYIFLDDDIKLSINEKFGNNGGNPWRVFEEFLIEHEPAVGVAHWWKQAIDINKPVNTVYQYDALFNAVHKDVMDLYFPLFNGFDDMSWWWSQVITIHTMAILCPATVLQCNSINVDNTRVGEYPNALFFGFPGKIFQKSLTREEDREKVIVKGIIRHSRMNGDYEKPTPAKYRSMVYQARHKVIRDHMLWKNHPFFKF